MSRLSQEEINRRVAQSQASSARRRVETPSRKLWQYYVALTFILLAIMGSLVLWV
jgi:hypothetical protein